MTTQLLLDLPEPTTTDPRFRLDRRTRELGLRKVAEARRILADAAARSEFGAQAA